MINFYSPAQVSAKDAEIDKIEAEEYVSRLQKKVSSSGGKWFFLYDFELPQRLGARAVLLTQLEADGWRNERVLSVAANECGYEFKPKPV